MSGYKKPSLKTPWIYPGECQRKETTIATLYFNFLPIPHLPISLPYLLVPFSPHPLHRGLT